MQFHEPTMAIMAAAIHTALALVLTLTIRRRNEVPGGDLWCLGMSLVATGLIALVGLMWIGLPGGRAVFNAGVLAGFVAFLEGVRRFDGAEARLWLVPLAALAGLVISFGFAGEGMQATIRVTLMSGLLVLASGAIALRVLGPGAVEEQSARVVILLAATGLGGIFCTRIAAHLLPGGLNANDATTRVLCYAGVSVLSIVFSFGCLLWANIRVSSQLARLARIDDLTGLANRLSLTELLARQHARWLRSGRPYSVVMINVDRFGDIDAGFGAATGDRVLLEVAKRIIGVARADDVCGRFGGDEFCILLPDTNVGEAHVLAERVRQAIGEEPFVLADGAIAVSVSIGVADCMVGERSHAVLRRADLALVSARQAGGNRVEGWQPPAEVPSPISEDDTGPLTSFLRSPLRA